MLRKYDEKVNEVREELIFIGDTVVDALGDALKCIKNEEISGLKDISVSFKKLDSKAHEIDNKIITTLALHSPEATDLREMVSFLRSTNELLRAARNTKEFVKLFRKAYSEDLNTKTVNEYAIPLLKSAKLSVETAVSMINETNNDHIEEKYQRVQIEESKTDDLYLMVEKNILKLMSKNLELSKEYFDILTALRRLERTSDRAVAIANLLRFAELGGEL
ncbi:MAG TPA: PhoU family transcriptional regulator [Arcobacter sp.]|jgi:phosphate transport system protein|nr:PhoU family transcriptional regulator [Arcobacter sp.]